MPRPATAETLPRRGWITKPGKTELADVSREPFGAMAGTVNQCGALCVDKGVLYRFGRLPHGGDS